MRDAFGVEKRQTGERVASGSEAVLGAGLIGAGVSANRFANHATRRMEGAIDRSAARKKLKLVQPQRTVPGAARSAKDKARAKRAQYYGKISQINAQRNTRLKIVRRVFDDMPIKGRKIPVGRGALITAGFGAGVPLAWHGARNVVDKRLDKHDVDAGMAGALTGVGAWEAGLYSTKKIDRRIERNIAADKGASKILRQHRRNVGLPNNAPKGDTRWLKYHRTWPKDVPGWKWKRTLSRLHGGKSQVAIAAGIGAVGAGTGLALNRKIDPVEGRKVSKSQEAP